MHNHHSAAFDGKKSPQELVLQRPLAECASTLIGMTVLAELPDSMKKTSLSRFVEAAYLYPEVGGLTHVVSSLVNGTPHHYRAKSIKHITPLKVGVEHCGHLLKAYDPSDTLAPPILKELDDGIPSKVEGEVDKAFEGKKRGKANHNAACKWRYDKWLKDQRERLVGEGEQGSVEGEPGSGSTAAPKVSSEARSSEDAGVPSASAPSVKRPKTSHESAGLEGEEPSAASKPDVIDVEMFEDPSIPYEHITDEEMPPGYFEPSRVPRLLESLHPRLDAPEGFTSACEESGAPKLAKVVNAVLIEKNTVFPEQVQMCGSKVWLAKMKSALSELDGCPLDVSSAMEDAHAFAKKHGIRIIPTRWVLGPKAVNGKEAVRARCVVQDALRTLLAIAAKDSMDILLPWMSDYYAPAYMILDQAMNGLRVAAKAWNLNNLKLANVVKKVGLNHCPTEPSVFEGTVKGKRFLMLCYVDDLILCGSSDAIKLVTDTLNRELKIKETGRITPTGGRIVFLGREIERNGEHLRMRVPPKYMESLFETDFCKDLKVVSSPPDLVKIVEKGRADPEKDSLLTEAAAMRYRAVLGRVAWWGQSRPDLARWMSILSQGQSKPTACFEHALRQVIRFLKGQYLCWSYFGPGSEVPDGGSATLDVYADASWAPQAELRAILTAVQESEGLATLIGQLAGSKVEIRICGIRFSRSDSGSSATQASPSAEVVPLVKDDMTDSQADTPKGSVEAPYWCKQCKWLFKTDHSHGLGWTDEYKPRCEKCQGVISVWGSNASYAFHLREGEKEKRFAKGSKGEGKSSQWVQGDGGKGEGANPGESPMAKGAPRPEGPPSVMPLFPELSGSEVPAWYTELWEKLGVRGVPLDQMDLQPLVESLSGEDLECYKKSFEKLSHPNYEVYEHGDPMPGKVVAVLDMRSQ
ncbi:RE1 [Symbiodinium sp. CCMP2592]|nr:RE1 [Symbiodinium sp. CCMP2592]